MKGYICDRCGATDPGQYDQREGGYPTEGWAEVMGVPGMRYMHHLCPKCVDEVFVYLEPKRSTS